MAERGRVVRRHGVAQSVQRHQERLLHARRKTTATDLSWLDARKTAKTPRRETPSTAPTACIGVYLSDLSMRLV